MNAQQRHAQAVEALNNYLKTDAPNQSMIPADEWEDRFKQLKAIRAWWGVAWDQIEREVKRSEYPEKWIWESRADEAFKRYYQLRMEIEKMEALLK